MHRRDFLAASACGTLAQAQPRSQPNLLWITCEDMGPHLGCYGDSYARTPNIDRLAQRSLRYRTVWSNAPVCAPARTAIISGMYPPSTGSEHMRSMTRLAAGQKMFPQILREHGYYCSNNVKEDYNLAHTGKVWDDSSNRAHWRNRAPGQPFFSVFNFTITHESQIRRQPHTLVSDPSKVRIPAYHPDTPEVRHDWAQYYDNIADMDRMAGAVLDQLAADGLAEDTIVFFFSDHGSGMPRSKRWPYDSGLHVPLIVHFPEKFRHLAGKDYAPGGVSEQLVSFVDLAPTVLSLAGIRKSDYHQGRAFLGQFAEQEPQYVFGFRGRMDERYDLVRSVRDKRYVYLRHYMPHRPYGQHVEYMFETPTTAKWKQLYDEGKLNAVQRRFWEPKPSEELYDLDSDPDEVNNLAASAAHRPILERMRKAQRDFMLRIRDLGLLCESEMHRRAESSAPYAMGHDPARYPLEKILAMAEAASGASRPKPDHFIRGLADADSGVRYWAATGLLISGRQAVAAAAAALEKALGDASAAVRIAAAEALARYGGAERRQRALTLLVELADLSRHGFYTALQALNAIDALGETAAPVVPRLRSLSVDDSAIDARMRGNYQKALRWILKRLGAPAGGGPSTP